MAQQSVQRGGNTPTHTLFLTHFLWGTWNMSLHISQMFCVISAQTLNMFNIRVCCRRSPCTLTSMAVCGTFWKNVKRQWSSLKKALRSSGIHPAGVCVSLFHCIWLKCGWEGYHSKTMPLISIRRQTYVLSSAALWAAVYVNENIILPVTASNQNFSLTSRFTATASDFVGLFLTFVMHKVLIMIQAHQQSDDHPKNYLTWCQQRNIYRTFTRFIWKDFLILRFYCVF